MPLPTQPSQRRGIAVAARSTLARTRAPFLPREEKAVQTISPSSLSFSPSLAGGQVDVVADGASGLQRACNNSLRYLGEL